MVRYLYKRMLGKLRPSRNQLQTLKAQLIPENICKGPFILGDKKCPVTTALEIKENPNTLKDAAQVRAMLRNHGVGTIELMLFYALFDIPAIASEKCFKKSLSIMQGAVSELIEAV